MISGRRHAEVVKRLIGEHERERARLLTIIADQNDRLMYLVGKPWGLPQQLEDDLEPELERDYVDTSPEAALYEVG